MLQLPCPHQIPTLGAIYVGKSRSPGHNFWSNAPGLPGGMVTLGIDWGIIQKSGKCVAKGPEKRLEVLKNELDKGLLNYMKLHIGVIMQKKIF